MNKYRHPKEWIAIGITLAVVGTFTLVLSIITFGLGFFVIAGGLVYLWIKVINATDLSYYIPASEEKNPDLLKLVYNLRNKWHIGGIQVYINPTREMQAEPSDYGNKFIIINQGLLDAIPGEKHRSFLVGHELAHAVLWHSWLKMLATKVEESYKGDYIETAFNFVATGFLQAMDFSADRIGLISCGSLKSALETLVFVELSDSHPNYEDVKKAVVYLSRGKSANNRRIKQIFSTHPEVYQRVYEMSEFAREMKMV